MDVSDLPDGGQRGQVMSMANGLMVDRRPSTMVSRKSDLVSGREGLQTGPTRRQLVALCPSCFRGVWRISAPDGVWLFMATLQ
jgi:hypothetical protein